MCIIAHYRKIVFTSSTPAGKVLGVGARPVRYVPVVAHIPYRARPRARHILVSGRGRIRAPILFSAFRPWPKRSLLLPCWAWGHAQYVLSMVTTPYRARPRARHFLIILYRAGR